MTQEFGIPLIYLTYSIAGLAIVYWVIRLAVRHAIQDADKRREL